MDLTSITESISPDGPPPSVPRDYSAAYVEELVNQLEWADGIIQSHLNRSRQVLAKLRTQINPH